MTRRLLAAAVLAILVPHVAFARPAVVQTLEAAARTRPSRAAAILHVFTQGAVVSVSDEVQGGWRRVDLDDGSVAWIEEGMLGFQGAAAASSDLAPVAAVLLVPPEPVALTANPGARTYVKDLSHLAMQMKGDLTVAPRAEALAARRRTSVRIWIVGGIASLALIGASVSKSVPQPNDPSFERAVDAKGSMMAGALVVGFATGLIGLLFYPQPGDLLEVVDAWNAAHPDRQVEMAVESGD